MYEYDPQNWTEIETPKRKKDYQGKYIKLLVESPNVRRGIVKNEPSLLKAGSIVWIACRMSQGQAAISSHLSNSSLYKDSKDRVLLVQWHCPTCNTPHRECLPEAWLSEGKLVFVIKKSQEVPCELTYDNPTTNKIKIRNKRHTTLFVVSDGGSIIINGNVRRVEYLDETHFNVVSPSGCKNCCHIDEFGDRVVGKGNRVQPIQEDGNQEENFNYYISENSGFVEVPKALLREIHLFDRLSWRNYQKGDMAYLEDMRDTSLFRSAMESCGRRVRLMVCEENPPISTYQPLDASELA